MDGMTLPLSVLVGDGASSPMSDCSETAGISRVDIRLAMAARFACRIGLRAEGLRNRTSSRAMVGYCTRRGSRDNACADGQSFVSPCFILTPSHHSYHTSRRQVRALTQCRPHQEYPVILRARAELCGRRTLLKPRRTG